MTLETYDNLKQCVGNKNKSTEDSINYRYSKAAALIKFVDSYLEFCKTASDETCLKKHGECDGMCIDCFAKWVNKKKHTVTKEQE